jgi:hypothetical protein
VGWLVRLRSAAQPTRTWTILTIVPPQANVSAAKAFNAAVAKYEHVTAPLTASVWWAGSPDRGR